MNGIEFPSLAMEWRKANAESSAAEGIGGDLARGPGRFKLGTGAIIVKKLHYLKFASLLCRYFDNRILIINTLIKLLM